MNAPLDPMNLDPIEQRLRRQPLRTLPEGWREEILASARQAGALRREPASPRVPVEPWWRAWLWPNPAAWAALAALWMVVIALQWDAPSSPHETARCAVANPDALWLYAEQYRELGQMLDPSPGPRPKPVILRPRSQRKDAPECLC